MKKLIALAAAIIFLSPCIARAIDVSVQAEDFTDSYNIMPESIHADGGSLIGLDWAGEWAQFQVSAATFGTYAVSLRCWGNANVPYHFHLITLPVRGEDPQTIEINYIGKGTCGA
ncbi:MAG: hypothetical protein NTW97_00795 [Candidatus Krumholzibacteria bacterium]|nr:hypothetical protein [Candidatus Krumholzibacteria bacterium]